MSVYDAYDPYTAYDSSPSHKNNSNTIPTSVSGSAAPTGSTHQPPPSSRQPDLGYRSSASLHDPGYRVPQTHPHETPGYRVGASYQDPGYRTSSIVNNQQDQHPGYRVPSMQHQPQHQQDNSNPGGYNRPNYQNG